ncbi:MAG: VCBS repeat-containing protein, partial [Bacteroidota bacterium]
MKKVILVIGLLVFGCDYQKENPEHTLFELLSSHETGIDLSNALTERSDFNILEYLYFYNGAGVAVGDLNNDSLPDIYFTANQKPNKLYLNLGGFKFKDITEEANVAGEGNWSTGVT